MLLKTHLDIISRNEPVIKKARFWQSYVRALKGMSQIINSQNAKYFLIIDQIIYTLLKNL